jgi:hypothetical protein
MTSFCYDPSIILPCLFNALIKKSFFLSFILQPHRPRFLIFTKIEKYETFTTIQRRQKLNFTKQKNLLSILTYGKTPLANTLQNIANEI